MTALHSHQPTLDESARPRADETLRIVGAQDMSMSARPDWPHEEFIAWLDGLRSQLGLANDHQLAAYLGMHHSRLTGWRSGQYKPSIPTLNKIASVIGEDPRRLWVLAGQANALDIGLLDEDVAPRIDLNLPDEIVELIAVYRREDVTEADRAAIRHQVRWLTQGIRADLRSRQAHDRPNSGKRAG